MGSRATNSFWFVLDVSGFKMKNSNFRALLLPGKEQRVTLVRVGDLASHNSISQIRQADGLGSMRATLENDVEM